MKIVFGLFALAGLVLPPIARAQTPARIDPARFDQADRRSRALISTIRCAQFVSMARARGEFGPVDSIGRIGQCIRVDSRNIGIFLDADTTFSSVTRFAAVDLGAHTRHTGPLDTAAVLAVVRAEQAAYARGAAEPFEKEHRPYAPLAFHFDGDSVEVWLVPVSLLRGPAFTVGGERGYLFSPDGRTLGRAVDAFGDYRPLAIPDTGTVYVPSRGTTTPTLSEMVLANILNLGGRNVAIRWAGITSVLVGRGDQAVWMQLTPKP